MDKNLQQYLDKQAIRELVWRYCRAIDRRDYKLLAKLYSPDSVDEHGDMFQGSGADFVRWVPSMLGTMTTTTHHITNMLIEVNGDHAQGELYALVYHRTTKEHGGNVHLVGGRYLDHYVKIASGEWLFKHRKILLDWQHPLPDQPSTSGQSPPKHAGIAGPDDLSYITLPMLNYTQNDR